MHCFIPFKDINIFGSFFIENILSIKKLLKKVVILVVFSEINYYEVFTRIFITLEWCKDKKSKFVTNFECEKLKFLSWISHSQDFQNLINW